jgi:predicted acyl esterase
VYTGGHGTVDEECWARALDWFRYFLGGHDTGVDAWPALTTVDANGGRAVQYPAFPQPVERTFFLDLPNLEVGYPSSSAFTIQQNLLNNPFQEPASLWDESGMPANQVPFGMRQDPSAKFFETAPITASEVVLGAPTLLLHLADPEAATTPFQVTAQLIHVNANDQSRILSRGAFAALDADDIDNGTVTVQLHWVKADLAPGDKLVLKVGGNDSSWFLPLPSNYSVTFDGASELHVPYFEG